MDFGLNKETIISRLKRTSLDEKTIETIAEIIEENNNQIKGQVFKVVSDDLEKGLRRQNLMNGRI